MALVTLLWGSLEMSANQRRLPPPLRVFVPFEAAWTAMQSILEKRNVKIARDDRGQGFIISEYREYISGPLTADHLAKVGIPPKVTDGDWIRIRYQYEILVELVEARETLVTVNTNIQALKRDFLGTESWTDIPTSGKLEEDLLTEFGQELFGQSFQLKAPKKGFWEREPTYVPDMEERIPKIVGPERP